MSKKISGAEYPLAKIFSSDFEYEMPSYQRPYAWTTDEASELFDDLYDFHQKEQEETYFLGSIVLIKDENVPKAEVIDGQQRLTTLTIVIAAIASRLEGESQTQFLKYILELGNEFEGLAPKPRLTLREKDRKFFAEYVQGMKFKELLKKDKATLNNESQRNIQANSRLILERMNVKLASESALKSFAAFLVQRCFLVAVSTPSQKSAFRVFSVLNNRGLDLLPTDIIKAEIIGQVAPAKRDMFNERWEDIEVSTGRDGFNELFAHIRMIFAKVKAKRALIEDFRDIVVKKATNSEELIDKIISPFAEKYLIAKNQKYISTENAQAINCHLKWLSRIDNIDWLPSAILFFSKNENDADISLWFVQKLERLAAFLHICGKNINERIERYEKVLTALHDNTDLCSAINLTVPEKEEFLVTLNGRIYEMPPKRRNYIILRLDSFISDAAATYDPSVLTIEHVLPQTVTAGTPWGDAWIAWWPTENDRKDWVHRIANLLPLTLKRNIQAQNYDFATKKSTYFGGTKGVSSYILTSQVLNTPDWTPKVVETRQDSLLRVFKDKWVLETS